MVKPEQKACLSTSPSSSVEASLKSVIPESESSSNGRKASTSDYGLVAVYILVYLEVAWLIFVLLRSSAL